MSRPFASAGYSNARPTFSSFEPDESFIKPPPAPRRPAVPQTSRRAASARKATRPNRPQRQINTARERKRLVDRNGCPIGTHTGNTGLYHRSKQGVWENTGAANQGLTMEGQQEQGYEWIKNDYVQKEHIYRDLNTFDNQDKRLTPGGFKISNLDTSDLFDPTVRYLATDNTAAPDRRMLEWVEPNRVKHAEPFKTSSVPREGRNDRGFVGSHKHYPAPYNPYEAYEGQHLQTSILDLGVGMGHRPTHRTSSRGIPFKQTTINNPIPSSFDRKHTRRSMRAMNSAR